MLYLINYDLHTPGKNYDHLIDAIQCYQNWAKISRSCWMIRSDSAVTQIRDHLMRYLDQNDLLMVCTVDSWAAFNLSQDVVTWLNN